MVKCRGIPISRAGRAVLAVAVVLGASACPPRFPGIEEQEGLYVRDVSESIHDLDPVRGERGPLRLHMDGDEYECSMCHDEFTGESQEDALEGQHEAIIFDHGSNERCLNCHHPDNPDVYVHYDGSEIPSEAPTELCRKCHGPHHREWTSNVHGRVHGAWGAEVAKEFNLVQRRLDCIQCHDPHSPKFEPMEPERPPVHTRFDLGNAGSHGETASDDAPSHDAHASGGH